MKPYLLLPFLIALFCPLSLLAKKHDLRTSMAFVTVSDIDNQSDQDTGYGAVDQIYEIGKYDVTASDYCEFLNAVASIDDPHQLFHPGMEHDPKVACIQREESDDGTYHYSVIKDDKKRKNFPITYVSWYSAARFCNWMQNGCPNGVQGPETTETGTYCLLDLPLKKIPLNPTATYFLPSENQWYKAAFFAQAIDPSSYYSYPTQSFFYPGHTMGHFSNQANCKTLELQSLFSGNLNWHQSFTQPSPPYLTPVGSFKGSPGPYGTYDMGGNVFQWTSNSKALDDGTLNFSVRGGSWNSSYTWMHHNELQKTAHLDVPPEPQNTIGFRLVRVPVKNSILKSSSE